MKLSREIMYVVTFANIVKDEFYPHKETKELPKKKPKN